MLQLVLKHLVIFRLSGLRAKTYIFTICKSSVVPHRSVDWSVQENDDICPVTQCPPNILCRVQSTFVGWCVNYSTVKERPRLGSVSMCLISVLANLILTELPTSSKPHFPQLQHRREHLRGLVVESIEEGLWQTPCSLQSHLLSSLE